MFSRVCTFLNRNRAVLLITAIACIALGLRFWFFFDRAPPRLSGQAIQQNMYTVVVDDDPEDKEQWQVFPARIVGSDVRIRVYAPRYPRYEYGDELKLSGKLSRPRNFKSELGRTFDYVHFLAKDGVYYELKSPEIEILQRGEGSLLYHLLVSTKRAFLSNIKAVLGEPHASLAGGLVVGEKSALGKDLIDDFRRSGLIHIVVLSGFNITIVATAIRRMLTFLPRQSAIIVGWMAMVLFCILVGGGATVVRSCIMASIALIAEFFRRDYQAGRGLLIAGYLMLFQNPSILLYDPSFQLSFLATLALILLATPMGEWLSRLPVWIRPPEMLGVRELVATTLATQVFVSPFIFYLMGEVSIVGVIVNILVLPIIPLTMLVVALVGLGGFVSAWLSWFGAVPAYVLLTYELYVVNTAAKLPYATIIIQNFSLYTLVLAYVIVGCFVFWLTQYTKKRRVFSDSNEQRIDGASVHNKTRG